MGNDLYRLVYYSRSSVPCAAADLRATVESILAASRRNNARAGVTGALMFNSGCFAQVLEGPREAVEETFERIQQDPRHEDVVVLDLKSVAERGFSSWSMAFVGQARSGEALFGHVAATSGFDPSAMEGDRVFGLLRQLLHEQETSANAA